ncbi:hypothetical protein Ancab_037004 [Ancistrocladus abbreviatus]
MGPDCFFEFVAFNIDIPPPTELPVTPTPSNFLSTKAAAIREEEFLTYFSPWEPRRKMNYESVIEFLGGVALLQ